MADSDKNIVIRPNRGATGSTAQPQIRFVGQNNDPITLRVLDMSGSSAGTLSFEGSAGQLFAISNALTSGSLFSVNDISGLPSIDVNANGTILFAGFTGNVGIGATAGISGSAYRLTVIGSEYVTRTLMVGAGISVTGGANLTGGSVFFGDIEVYDGAFVRSGGLSVTGGASITGGMNVFGRVISNDGMTTSSLYASGATFVGNIDLTNNILFNAELETYFEPREAAVLSGDVLVCDMLLGQAFTYTLPKSITGVQVTNVPSKANTSIGFTLVLTQGTTGGYTAAFGTFVGATARFPGGTAPNMTTTANKTDIVSYITYDNGSNWYGFVGGQAF